MLIVAFFTAFSALIVATPLPANHRASAIDFNSRSTLYRRAPPKFEIPTGFVPPRHRKDTIENLRKHYETEATDEQKRAGLVSATSRWKDQPSGHPPGQEFLTFNYHAGDSTNSPVIPPASSIVRDKAPPKIHFQNVPREHREEMELAGLKRYRDLSPDRARRVRSMKAWDDWHLDGGIREKTKFTFHSNISPRVDSLVGRPTTISRSLTLKLPEVPSSDKFSIDQSVRAAHKKMLADPQHPATTSNYGTVRSNWHDSWPDADGKTHKQVVVELENVPESGIGRMPLGDYAVRMGTADHEPAGSNAGGPSSHTAAGTSHAGPPRVNNEVVRQEQHHINIGSSSESGHTLPSNSGPSHLNNQGPQLNAGSPSSHASRPELLHATSPQQPLQLHAGSSTLHNELHMPSPGVWDPWDPLSQPSRQALHPDLYTDQLWHTGSPHLQSPPSNSQILPHPNSPPSQFRAGDSSPTSRPGPSHPELLHPGSSQQAVHPHIAALPLGNEFYTQWEPESQPLKGAHSGLYTDSLWHTGPPHLQSPPPNSQILPHPNSPPSQFRAGNADPSSRPGPSHPELLHTGSPQQLLQPTGSPPLHNIPPDSQSSHDIWQTLHELHPSIFNDPIWHEDILHPQSPPLVGQVPPHPSSPPSQFRGGGPSSRPGPSHPELLHPVPSQQALQPHTALPLGNEFYTQWDQPSKGAHPGLYTDSGHPHFKSPPPNSQIPPHPSSPPSQFRGGGPSSRPGPSHPELLHPISPQQPVQPAGSPPLHNEYYIPPDSQSSLGIWQTLQALHPSLFNDPIWHDDTLHPQSPPLVGQVPPHPSSPPSQFRGGNAGPSSRPVPSHPVLPQQSSQPHAGNQPLHNDVDIQWEPESPPLQGIWRPSGQLSHTDSWHPESQSSNNQILPQPNSLLLHPDAWSPGPAQSSSTVLPIQRPPSGQVVPPSNPSGSPHPSQPDTNLSPEMWHMLNPDSYPYPWNPHQHNP